jgi:hypothetical protein
MQPASAAMATGLRDNCFLCLLARDEAFYAYQLWKKIEIEFTQNNFFQRYGLSGWIFCSRQNTQWYILDLSVLFYFVLDFYFLTKNDQIVLPLRSLPFPAPPPSRRRVFGWLLCGIRCLAAA